MLPFLNGSFIVGRPGNLSPYIIETNLIIVIIRIYSLLFVDFILIIVSRKIETWLYDLAI